LEPVGEVWSQSAESRSRIRRAEMGYSLKSHGPVRSYAFFVIGGNFNRRRGQLHELLLSKDLRGEFWVYWAH
jgi:hypothetical protein